MKPLDNRFVKVIKNAYTSLFVCKIIFQEILIKVGSLNIITIVENMSCRMPLEANLV